MLHRYESRQRNYTELCNRSSSGSCGTGHVAAWMPTSCDPSEDYWEDASVSLRSCHSWEPPSSPWLGAPTSAYVKIDGADENKRFTGLGSHPSRPQRYTFDDNECFKGRRSFPPPLASCATLSIKEGGRFVLKEMDVDRPQGFFRAQRGNGRLRLQLVLPDEVFVAEEDEHEDSSSPVEDTTVSKVDSFVEFSHAECDAPGEETITSNQEDCSTSDEEIIRSISNEKVVRSVSFDDDEGPFAVGHVCAAENFDTGRPAVQDVGSEVDSNACSTSYDVGTDAGFLLPDVSLVLQVGMKNTKHEGEVISALDGFYSSDPHQDISNRGEEVVFLETDNFLTFGKHELNHLVAESKRELHHLVAESSNGSIEQEPLWNVDVSNQALASLSPWSPKQMCLHQSIVNMRPAFGLAMS